MFHNIYAGVVWFYNILDMEVMGPAQQKYTENTGTPLTGASSWNWTFKNLKHDNAAYINSMQLSAVYFLVEILFYNMQCRAILKRLNNCFILQLVYIEHAFHTPHWISLLSYTCQMVLELHCMRLNWGLHYNDYWQWFRHNHHDMLQLNTFITLDLEED